MSVGGLKSQVLSSHFRPPLRIDGADGSLRGDVEIPRGGIRGTIGKKNSLDSVSIMAKENKRRRIIRLLRENPTLAAKYGRGEIGLRKAEKIAGLVPKDLSIPSADIDEAVRKLAQHYGSNSIAAALQGLSEKEKPDWVALKAEDLIPYKESAKDFRLTGEIVEELAARQRERDPFYLNLEELEKLGQWKDAARYDPYGKTRNTRHRQKNTDAEVKEKTLLAFRTEDLKGRIEALTQLKGVAVPTATAIMSFVDPTRYAILDFRAWRQIFGDSREPRSIAEYERLLPEIVRLAEELGWTIQNVDHAIWAKDAQEFGHRRRDA